MKKPVFLLLLCILLKIIVHAQSPYTKQNLEQASQADLTIYMEKAQQLKKTGTVLVIAGPIAGIGGLLLVMNNFDLYSTDKNGSAANTGVIIGYCGVGAALIGLPILANGITRVNRIKSILNDRSNGISLEFSPCTFQDYLSRNYPIGATLRIRF